MVKQNRNFIFKKMLIGELSKKSNLSRDTIRFYEKQGLIKPEPKPIRTNDYKEFSEASLARLLSIKQLKSFGFTLNECAELLEMIDANKATCANVTHKIEEKVKLLDEKIKELIAIRSMLLKGLNKCQKSDCSAEDENCVLIVNG